MQFRPCRTSISTIPCTLRNHKVHLHYIRVAHLSILCTVQSRNTHNSTRNHMAFLQHRSCHRNTTLQQCDSRLRHLSSRNLSSRRERKASFSNNGIGWIASQRPQVRICDKERQT